MARRVHLLWKGAEVPTVDHVAADLDRLDVLHLCHLLMLTDGGIVHAHLACVLGLVKLNHSGSLLDCYTCYLEFVLHYIENLFRTMLSTILSLSTGYR